MELGPYRLMDRIAVGGMAEVFRAHEPRPVGEPRLVALKRMLSSVAREPRYRTMFQEEARLGSRIKHPNVVEVLGFGDEGGQPYLALEYVPGTDLWRLIRYLTRDGRRLGVDVSVFVIGQLLRGLHAVHEAKDEKGQPLGVVHRDVSPSNVLLSIHGDVKISDFGIATAELGMRPPNAQSVRAKGKLGYLAPEQIAGEPTDRRADLFGAAVIAAELLMGRPLFAGGSELAVLLAIREAQIRPFLEVVPTLPTGLGEAIIGALARDPEERVSTAAELWALLQPFCHDSNSEVREELASIVRTALRASELPSPPPGMEVDEATPLFEVPDEIFGTATGTGPVPAVRYRVRHAMTRQKQEMTYAEVVEAVSVGRLGPADLVAKASGEFQPISSIADLSRHLPAGTATPATAERGAPIAPDEVVALRDGGIITALSRSALRRDTGLWLCEAGGVRKEVYVKDGTPEFVTSNLAEELLGEFLVARGVISRGELDMALAVMPRFEGRLGDTLAALGLMEPVHLFQHIASQVREKLLDLFLWTGGNASLYLGVPPPESAFPLGLDPWKILCDGVGRRLQQGVVSDRLSDQAHRRVVRSQTPPAGFDVDLLTAELRSLVLKLETPTAVGHVLRETVDPAGEDALRGERELHLLMSLGAVEWCGAEEPEAA